MRHIDSPAAVEHKIEMCRQPWLHHHGFEEQPFGTVTCRSNGQVQEVKVLLCQRLNQTLADMQVLVAQIQKLHRLSTAREFSALHKFLSKSVNEQMAVADNIATRIRCIGGTAISDPRHIAEVTQIPRGPDGSESIASMLSRLIETIEYILVDAQETAAVAKGAGEPVTATLMLSRVMAITERHGWILAEHLAKPAVCPQ